MLYPTELQARTSFQLSALSRQPYSSETGPGGIRTHDRVVPPAFVTQQSCRQSAISIQPLLLSNPALCPQRQDSTKQGHPSKRLPIPPPTRPFSNDPDRAGLEPARVCSSAGIRCTESSSFADRCSDNKDSARVSAGWWPAGADSNHLVTMYSRGHLSERQQLRNRIRISTARRRRRDQFVPRRIHGSM
jgi:hypothetical protein